jgi:hypothetical protein
MHVPRPPITGTAAPTETSRWRFGSIGRNAAIPGLVSIGPPWGKVQYCRGRRRKALGLPGDIRDEAWCRSGAQRCGRTGRPRHPGVRRRASPVSQFARRSHTCRRVRRLSSPRRVRPIYLADPVGLPNQEADFCRAGLMAAAERLVARGEGAAGRQGQRFWRAA